MADIKQNFSGDASGLEKELKKLQKEVIRLREENSKTAKESVSENNRHQRSLKKLGETVRRDVATPMEQYRSKLTQLRQSQKAGYLTQDQYRRGVDQLKDSVRRQNQETGRGAGLIRSFAGSMGRLGAGVAIWNSLTGAAAAYNEELERRANLEKGFTDKAVQVAKQQSMFLSNTASLTPESRQEFLNDVQGVSRDIGYADVGQLTASAGGAFSASFGENPEEQKRRALEATRASGMLTRLRPDETQLFAGGALDMMKASGVDDAKQALNYLQALIAEVRVEDPKKLLSSAPKAISDMVATDQRGAGKQSAIEAGAIFGAMTSAMVDKTGDVSKTAGRQFSMEMEKFFTKGFEVDDSVVKGKKEGKELIKPTVDPGSPLARLQAIQKDPELAKAFMSKASLGEAELVVREALDPSSMVAESINSKVTNMSANAFGTKLFDQQVKEQSLGTPQVMIASEMAHADSAEQSRTIGKMRAQRNELARKRMEQILDNTYQWTAYDTVSTIPFLGQVIPDRKYMDRNSAMGLGYGAETRLQRGEKPEQVILGLIKNQEANLLGKAAWVANETSVSKLPESERKAARAEFYQERFDQAPAQVQDKLLELQSIKQEMLASERRWEQYMAQQAETSQAMLDEMKGMRDDAKNNKSPDQQTTAVGVDQHR